MALLGVVLIRNTSLKSVALTSLDPSFCFNRFEIKFPSCGVLLSSYGISLNTTTYRSIPSPPLSIPENGGPDNPATNTIFVNATFTVVNVFVELSINHTWIGDLGVDITSSTGTFVKIIECPQIRDGGSLLRMPSK